MTARFFSMWTQILKESKMLTEREIKLVEHLIDKIGDVAEGLESISASIDDVASKLPMASDNYEAAQEIAVALDNCAAKIGEIDFTP